jgi:hypothetical protein
MSNLFIEVSAEQQEVVSGGFPAGAQNNSLFAGLINIVAAEGSSGPDGSDGKAGGISDKRLTSNQSTVVVDSPTITFPGLPVFPAL